MSPLKLPSMAERMAVVETKVDHLSEKIEITNKALSEHSNDTKQNFDKVNASLERQGQSLDEILLWFTHLPKIIKGGAVLIVATILASTGGWRVIFDIAVALFK